MTRSLRACAEFVWLLFADELSLLQYLHSWKLVQFDATRIELSHRDEIAITIVLGAGGIVEDYEIVLLDSPAQQRSKMPGSDELRAILTSFLFDRLRAQLAIAHPLQGDSSAMPRAKDLLRTLSSLWTAARRLRAELLLVQLRYPLSAHLFTKKSRAGPFLRATARVYAHTARAEFAVVFELTGEEMACAELENVTEGVGVAVDVKYGHVE